MKALSGMITMSALCLVMGQSAQSVRAQETPQTDAKKQTGFYEKVFPDAKAQKTPGKGGDTTTAKATGRLEPDDTTALPSDVPAEIQAHRRGLISEEEAAIVPYYNNFLTNYHLGPEDVISISVFGQERYSRSNITVPPNAKISYPLIPEGIFVAGKTVEQVQDELTKKLDEYIIDPKISVSLDKAASARYSVLGDVGTPGVKIMNRRLSVYEAVAEAGGVLATGDKSKVFVIRFKQDGSAMQIPVNLKEFEKGRAEIAFLVPGDQVIVPGNTMKKVKSFVDLISIVSFARLFTGGW